MKSSSFKSSSLDPNRWIVVAQLIRPHGFPRGGVFRYRAQFDTRGSDLLMHASKVGLSPLGFDSRLSANQSLLENFQVPFVEVPLAEASSPLGGKWPQAEAAILAFNEKDIPKDEPPHGEKEWVGRSVAIRRNDFPKIDQSEVYLCDLVKFDLRSTVSGPVLGHVYAFSQIPKSQQFNIIAKSSRGGEDFEFPMAWVDWSSSSLENSFLVVPGVEEWMS